MKVVWMYHDYRKLEKLTNFLYTLAGIKMQAKMTRAVRTNNEQNPYIYEIEL